MPSFIKIRVKSVDLQVRQSSSFFKRSNFDNLETKSLEADWKLVVTVVQPRFLARNSERYN